ncbi:clustered mitochondria protein homolog, partial [Stylophora pistillata]|uniref:clustered mitochondria protein homolog n=1 Tax=Stylophora pistillata TaxID=50429 RepID=UPI000C046A87
TLQMNPPEQTDVTTDQQPIPHDESDSGRDTNREDESIVAGNHADQSRDRSGVMAPCWGYTEESTNFLMSFSTALPDGAESYEFMGDFENLPPVTLEYLNAFTLTGCSPIREDPGKVTVKVYYTSEKGMMQFGDDLCFEYKDRIDEAITVMMANQPARDAIAVGAFQGLRSSSRGPRRPNPFSPPQTAKEFYDRALAIRLKKLGPDHVDVAWTYANLGIVHRNLGDLSQAKEFYDRALAIRLKKLGPDHVDVAQTYANLGNVHRKLGDLSQGKEFYDRALSIRLKTLGPEHVDLANTYHNLGIVHRNLGDLSQAKEFHDRALAIRLKKLGPDHVDVASTYSNLELCTAIWVTLEREKSIMIAHWSFF